MLGTVLRSAPRSFPVLFLVAISALGCSAVYPEVATPMRQAPPGKQLQPESPPDLVFLGFKSAVIPNRTRDGRRWDSVGGSKPDPYAVFFLNEVELFRTPVHGNTLNPTWPNQKRDNYRIQRGSKIRIELWDSNPVNPHPICVKRLSGITRHAEQGEYSFDCSSGARVTLIVEPAHAKVGLGLFYELRTEDVFVSRVLKESPAARAGLKGGEQIATIMGQEVRGMDQMEVKSLINANSVMGVTLGIKVGPAEVKEITLKEGPIYPEHGESLPR